MPLFVSTLSCPGCGEEIDAVGVWDCACGFHDHRERHILAGGCPACGDVTGRINCPAVIARSCFGRLQFHERATSPTRQPPAAALTARFVAIGQNAHRGQLNQVAIPADLRARHCYIAGATGTGKSTLLTNLMVQDIAASHGVGLLDPHGDLVKVILKNPAPAAIPVESFTAHLRVKGEDQAKEIKFEPAPKEERPKGEKAGTCSHFIAKVPWMKADDNLSIVTFLMLEGERYRVSWENFNPRKYAHHED